MSESKPYSGIPLQGRRSWTVPRWLKDVFAGFALACVVAVGVGKYLQLFGGKLERARASLDAIDAKGPARPFVLPRRGGGDYDLARARGKLTLVNFWATWCPPCIEELPSLTRLAAAMDPATFELVAVSVDKSWAPVEKLFSGKPVPYAVALDAKGETSLAYGTSKFPETYLVDGEGNLKLKFVGPRDWGDPGVVLLLEQLGARRAAGSPEAGAKGNPG